MLMSENLLQSFYIHAVFIHKCCRRVPELMDGYFGVQPCMTAIFLDKPFYGVYYGQLAMPFGPDTIKYLTNDAISNAKVLYYDTGIPKAGDMYNMQKANSKDPYEMFLSGVAPVITIENDL